MHICFLCNEYPPGLHGGVGSVTQTLARALVKRGQRVSVIGTSPIAKPVVEDDQGVSVRRLPHSTIPSTGLLVNGYRLRRVLEEIDRAEPIDIVEGPELSLAALYGNTPGFRLIRMHGGHHFFATTLHRPTYFKRQLQERLSFDHANGVCAVSRFVAETTRELLCLGTRPIEILPNPVDTGIFYPMPDIQEDPGLVLFYGSLCEKKGIRQLIHAMPRVIKSVPDARLWVVGRDTTDPDTSVSYEARLREEVPQSIRQHIVFRGPAERNDLPAMIASAAVAVFPSHMEAHSVAPLETMAMGKTTIASSIAPSKETIDDLDTGLLCDATRPDSIADVIIRALQDRDLRRTLGARALEKVSQQFSVDVMAGRNIEFYQRCVRGFRPNG